MSLRWYYTNNKIRRNVVNAGAEKTEVKEKSKKQIQ
jgi:hypothetical protein